MINEINKQADRDDLLGNNGLSGCPRHPSPAFDQWPDTGQTNDCTSTFGENSNYQGPARSYSKLAVTHGQETVSPSQQQYPLPGPTIDTSYFPKVVLSCYWSSTASAYWFIFEKSPTLKNNSAIPASRESLFSLIFSSSTITITSSKKVSTGSFIRRIACKACSYCLSATRG